MTGRRFNTSPTVSPHLTRGDDRPRGNCDGQPEPFDALVDLTAGPGFKEAQRQARALCGVRDDGMFRAPAERCPLAATCLMRDNADETWARAVSQRPGNFSPVVRSVSTKDGPAPAQQRRTGPSPHHSTSPRSRIQ